MAKHIFISTSGTEDWKRFLAKPEKQWRKGFSARTLAHCWEDANGFPPEVEAIFVKSTVKAFQKIELLLAFPEYKVHLPPMNGHPSQNDLFVLAKDDHKNLFTIAVEGKVSETFDRTIGEWKPFETKGKTIRYEFLRDLLGLKEIPSSVRYQLLHRSASAILEAQKFKAKNAVMLIHSFSPDMLWFDDFQSFVNLFDVRPEPDKLYFIKNITEIGFYVAWVKGNPDYLEK